MFKWRYQSEETLPLIPQKRNKIYQRESSNESDETVNKYPKAVYFILISKFFEAFAANGIRTILALYLRDDLLFTEKFATVMLHIFNFFSQFCPLLGAVLADSYIGKAKTVAYFFIIYAGGWIGIVVTSLPFDGIPLVFLIILSLLLLSIGNGSIRACITSLGAIQFTVPEQNSSLASYFSHYYLVYYIGIFLSKILPPFIRVETSCFDQEKCYPAVFGTLGIAFLSSWIIFILGLFFYKDEEPAQENVLFCFFGCIRYALVQRVRNYDIKETHWLRHAIGRYSKEFIEDVIVFLKVCTLFLPLPIYWALLAQQDSSWTFQASQMNTTLFGINFEPDQAKAMGPIFLFSMIPIWKYFVSPIFECFGLIIHPLHSVAIGGICSAMAFVYAGLLQAKIECALYKSISIVWQIPQFILLMMGELFLSIPGLQFAFTEAPTSMKSVLTAAWFLNNAIGNIIVVTITEIKPVEDQSSEYFIYAILMFLCISIFTIMACNYLKQSSYHCSKYTQFET